MKHEGISVKNAIKYLGGFYHDLEQMWSVLENHLLENSMILHPAQGNKTGFSYPLSNDIQRGGSWLLRNIQRYFVPEDRSDKAEQVLTDRSIVMSVSLYENSLFEFPVIMAGVIKYKNEVSLNDIWNYWLWSEICSLDTGRNSWRFNDSASARGPVYKLKTISQRKIYDKKNLIENIIDYIEVYFIDLVKLANTESVISAVNPIIEIFHNNESYTFPDNSLIVTSLPELLIKEWSR